MNIGMIAKIIETALMALLGAGAAAGIAIFIGVLIAVLFSDDWRDED